MCLSFETNEALGAMTVAPHHRAGLVCSLCFPEEVPNYDLPEDLGDNTNGVTLPDTYIDEMDMISIGRILDATPRKPYSTFDMFGVSTIYFEDVTLYDTCTNVMDLIGIGRILDVALPYMFGISMLEIDNDDGFVAIYIIYNTVSIEGASDYVDPPLSFDTMFGFVTRFNDISDGNNDMSIFEYLPMSRHFPFITPSSPTTHIFDVDDVGDIDDPLGGQSECDFDTEDMKVTPITGSTELIDFRTPDQPKEIRIGSSLSPDERSRLIDLLKSYFDVFAWSYEDMSGLNSSIVQHHLPILPHAGLVK